MIFRLARIDELNEILNLYIEARQEEYCIWNDQYPSMFEIRNDFETNNLFVMELDNKIVGAISIVPENEMDDFDEWIIKDNVIEVARVVVEKNYHGKSIAFSMMNGIINLCKERKNKVIHLACYVNNPPAINVYKKLNFNFICRKNMYEHEYYLCELIIE